LASRIVEYIFQLVDKFSANASNIAKAAMSSEKGIHAMGKAADAAEAKVGRLAKHLQGLQQKMLDADPAFAAAHKRLQSLGPAGVEAAKGVRSFADAHKAVVAIEKEHANRSRYTAAGPGFMGGAMEAWFGADMIIQAAKGVGHFLDHANHQLLAKQKMGFVGFHGELMEEADHLADSLSKKYKNISKGDVLEQLYEGVAIHGDAKHAIENVEQQTRLASFLQGFEGGKHGSRSKEWTREVFAAVKSMEQFGVLNEHDPQKKTEDINNYLGSLMAMKALYGDQAKINDYLTAQRRAGASFYRLSDEFRFGYLPSMIQERGGATVGQQLMTAFSTIVGGTKLSQNQLGAMKKYGMIDPKTGRFANSFVESYLKNPYDTAQQVAETVARVNNLNMKDPKQLEQLKDKLTREIGWLFPNRNAASAMLDMFMNDKNYRKHAEAMREVRKEMEAIAKGEFFAAKTKGGSEASVAKQWDNFLASLGTPVLPAYIDRMNRLAGIFNGLSTYVSDFTKAHPKMAQQMGSAGLWGLGALGGLAGLGVLGALGRGLSWGLAPIISGIAGAVKLLGMGSIAAWRALASVLPKVGMASRLLTVGTLARFAGIAGAFFIAAEVVDNWDRIVGVMERLSGLNLDKVKDLQWALHEIAAAFAAAPKVLEDVDRILKGKPRPEDGGMPEYDAAGNPTGNRIPMNPSSVPQGEANKEITVRTQLDPIKVDVTQSVPLSGTVRVEGTINGPVNGSGAVTGAASGRAPAPRGESAPVGGGN
jgi:hypothetical protein